MAAEYVMVLFRIFGEFPSLSHCCCAFFSAPLALLCWETDRLDSWGPDGITDARESGKCSPNWSDSNVPVLRAGVKELSAVLLESYYFARIFIYLRSRTASPPGLPGRKRPIYHLALFRSWTPTIPKWNMWKYLWTFFAN